MKRDIKSKDIDFTCVGSGIELAKEVAAGFGATPDAKYLLEVDRATAIKSLIDLAQPGDILLIAGKGHETYQIFADRTIHFDDYEIARAALEAKKE